MFMADEMYDTRMMKGGSQVEPTGEKAYKGAASCSHECAQLEVYAPGAWPISQAA